MSAIDYTKAYITHNDGTSLGTIDENNTFENLGTFVDGDGNALTKVYGLAFGKDGEIYLTQQQGGSNEDLGGSSDTQIWKANLPAVGEKVTLTKIGTGLGFHGDIAIDAHAMDIGPDGSMYILDLLGNIFTVDLSTGLASFVAETVVDGDTENAQISNAMDIVFDANFTLYAQGYYPGSKLFTVNASTGAATSVGAFGSGTNIMGLWANSENTIYATKYSNSGNLYTVNPASAALTLVGSEGAYGNKPHGGDKWIAYGGWSGSDPSTLTSATYDASTGALTVTGTNLAAYAGAANDIDVSKLTIAGEGGNTYTLTSDDVELTSSTEFSITLNAADQLQLAGLLNKNGTSSGGGTTYNIAAAEDWAPGADASTDIADLTGNAITVSNVAAPTLTGAGYDASTGELTVTGTNLPAYPGATNDIDISKLTLTGEGGNTYTLTSDDVELTSSTEFSITLNSADQTQLAGLLNKNGGSSGGGTTYNIAAAEDWAPGADASTDIADLTGNAIAVMNVAAPTLTSAAYDASTGALTITGTNLPAYAGATNDIDISKLTLTGEGGATYALTSDDVELTSSTEFSITLNAADQSQLASLLDYRGTSSSGGTTYNIAAAEDWAPGADASTDIADLTGNAITVSNVKHTWSFSNDYLEEQTLADLNGNGVIGDGTSDNATAPTGLSSATYAAGDDYLVEGTLASTSALDAVKSFFSRFNSGQSITFDSSSAYTYTNLSDTAENLSSVSSTDLGNVTTTLTVSDSASSPALLSTLQSIKGAFSGSTFIYNGVKGTTKDLADARDDSGFDWITNITASSGVKHATITDLSVSAANTQTFVTDLSSSEYFFTISGMTANSSPFIAVPAGDNATLGYQSDSSADATTNYTPGASSYTSGDYTVTALGFANTETPTEGNLDDFNVASRDVSEAVELTIHFYGGEQLSHVNISGADLSTSTGYSYSQTAGSDTSSVDDDIWTLNLKIEAGQPANTESVSDNTGKEVLGVMINSVSADSVGGYNDYGGSVFRTNAWWNDISLMSEGYKFSDLCPGFGINGTNGEEVDFDFYFTKDYLERTFSVDFDSIDGGFAGTGLSSVDASNDHSGTYIDVSKSGSTSELRLPVSITDVSATTAGGATDFYQVAFTNDSWSEANLSMVYGPSVNNAPPVLSTPTAGSISETADSSDTTTSGLSGTLSASDDDGDSLSFSITDGSTTDGTSTLAGSYGSLTVDTSSGEYTYTPDSSAVEALDDGDSAADSFTVNASDGTDTTSATYTVDLTGADDPSVITADSTGSLTEDSATTSVTGSISIADPDADDSPSFPDVDSTTTSNGYGSYSLSSGTWSYTLDNDNTKVNALSAGDTLSDSFTLTATDNTTQTITITINGADEDDDSELEEDDTDSELEEENIDSELEEENIDSELEEENIDSELEEENIDSELEDVYTLANYVRSQQSYVLVDDTGNNNNLVTALTTTDVSINLLDKFSKQARNSQKTLRLLKKTISNRETPQTTKNRLINKSISFVNQAKEEGVTQIDVRTIVPTSTSEIPNQHISITGSAKTKQIEAFVIDLSQMPGVTELELHNIDYSVIIGPANITGGSGKNILQADDASQTINLGRDDDKLFGGGGNDTVSSSGGNDVLAGQHGNDIVNGGRGSDIVRGGKGKDHLRGQKGQDRLKGGANRDVLRGGRSHDVLLGAHGRDTLIGGPGNDRLVGGAHNDILRGRHGNDLLQGGEGSDKLNGGPGRDILSGEGAADRFKLSAGKDSITDYNPTEGDRLLFSKDLELSITEAGNDVILADKSNEIHTVLLNTSLESVIASHPQLA
ncbi:VCBS domain-containing protein [Synechococcus sp. AH-736-G21]|nr:VCBS domain-containing protein [Synechococcus sp. AH-736-G21]